MSVPALAAPSLRLVTGTATTVNPKSAGSTATSRLTFPGSVAPLPVVSSARTSGAGNIVASSVGALSTAQVAVPMELNVAMAMRNFAEFQTRVSNGETVPFDEMEAKYLPLPGDYAAVRAWLVGQGFGVTMDDERRLGIFIRGTVAQIQASFGVAMQSVTVAGETSAAATTAPSLPASIAGSVLGINGLQPYLKPRRHVRVASTPAPTSATDPTPQTSNAPPFLVPEIRQAYDAASLSIGGTTLTGANQKIAIIIDSFPLTSDLTSFWSANGISQSLSNIEEVNVPGGKIDATAVEETLDVEWASSVAPGSKVRVYVSDTLSFTNINKCLSRLATDVSGTSPAQPLIHELSMSLGIGETSLGAGSSVFTTESQYFAVIANGSTVYGGVSVFVSAGDNGSTPSGTLQAEYESTDPNVTGVGGTALQLNTGTGRRTSEVVWDDTTAVNGFASAGATGGGTSIQFARPAWQVGPGVPTGTKRLAPDVCAVAAESTPGYLFYQGSATSVAGTSWSAPTWAGFAALINQGRSVNTPARLPAGFLNPRIYPLIGTTNFYDVTSGDNVLSASAAGTTNGVANYTAQTGYDECTGLGAPDVAVLLHTLLGPTITNFSPVSGAGGTSVVITGTNFYTSAALPVKVTFNGTAAASVTVNSATQITAVAPSGVTNGPIMVTSLGDAATSATNFPQPVADDQIVVSNPGTVSQDDNGDAFTLTVSNVGTLATSGTTTVTATPAHGLYIAALSGTGWTCSPGAGNAGGWTCTRADALAAGSAFPTLTASVNVSPTATSAQSGSFIGHVVVSGDSNQANDDSNYNFAINAVTSTPTQQWRYNYFNTTANRGNAADAANPAGDGINNLTKYALGLDPTMAEASPLTEDIGTGFLRLTVPKNPNATDVTYGVQVTSDLTDPASWTTSGTTVDQNTSTLLQVQDNTPVSGTAKRFIRLQISR